MYQCLNLRHGVEEAVSELCNAFPQQEVSISSAMSGRAPFYPTQERNQSACMAQLTEVHIAAVQNERYRKMLAARL